MAHDLGDALAGIFGLIADHWRGFVCLGITLAGAARR
jgi:hypothetical protein